MRSYVDHEYREKGETRIFFRHKDKSACAGKSISCLSARDQSEDKLLRFLDRLFFSQFPSVDEKLLRLYYARRVHLFRVHQRCWENVNNVLRRKKNAISFRSSSYPILIYALTKFREPRVYLYWSLIIDSLILLCSKINVVYISRLKAFQFYFIVDYKLC